MNECSIILAHMETNQRVCYQVPFTVLAHILWLPKNVTDLCLYQLHVQMHMYIGFRIFLLCSYRFT